MKKILLLLIIANIHLLLAQSDWKKILNYEHNREFNQEDAILNITCIDSLNCICTQKDKYLEIVHSTDGGRSWFAVNDEFYDWEKDPTPKAIRSVNAAWTSNENYFVQYNEGYIKISSDKGLSFYDTIALPNKQVLEWFEMEDNNNGICYYFNEIFYTNDGWDSFKLIEGSLPGVFATATLVNGKIKLFKAGYVGFKSRYMETTDYGKTWIKGDTLDFQPNQIYFYDENIGWAVGSRKTGIGSKNFDMIYKTTNGGKKWIEQMNQTLEPMRGISEISFIDKNYGIAVGGFGKLYITSDGGSSWEREILEYDDTTSHNGFAPNMTIGWSAITPIIGTVWGGIFRYEGNFFKHGLSSVEDEILNNKIKMKYNNSFLQISIEDKSFKKYKFIISDILGNKVKTGELDSGHGVVYQAIDIRTLISGSYYLLLSENGNYVSSGKFYKQE